MTITPFYSPIKMLRANGRTLPYVETFVELQSALAALPNQHDGVADSLSQTKEEYQEFQIVLPCRPGDEKVVERYAVCMMHTYLDYYLSATSGAIYWRIPLEFDVADSDQIVRYDDNGPDIDFTTNRRCVKDHNWKRVALYCRLLKSDAPVVFDATGKTFRELRAV